MNIDQARACLGVGPEAGPAELRRAYLEGVRRCPPDRSPREFEQIRDAYQHLRDGTRGEAELLGGAPGSLLDLVEELGAGRPFLGPAPWLAVLRGER